MYFSSAGDSAGLNYPSTSPYVVSAGGVGAFGESGAAVPDRAVGACTGAAGAGDWARATVSARTKTNDVRVANIPGRFPNKRFRGDISALYEYHVHYITLIILGAREL